MTAFSQSAFDAYVAAFIRALLDLQSRNDRGTAMSDATYAKLTAQLDAMLTTLAAMAAY